VFNSLLGFSFFATFKMTDVKQIKEKTEKEEPPDDTNVAINS